MENRNLLNWVTAGLLITFCVSSLAGYSQNRSRKLPDGTVVYSDGTIKRNDGTLKFPDGRVRQTDGSIKYPDGSVRYPGNNNTDKQFLPPGHAKKIYGTKSAKPFTGGNKENAKGRNK